MIRTLYYTPHDDKIHTDLTPDAFERALQDALGVLWVDLAEEPEETCYGILRDIFNFHPLAVDDALEETHIPKVDDWETYVYLVLHAITPGKLPTYEDGQAGKPVPHAEQPEKLALHLETLELDCFLGPNYLVTYQARVIEAVNHLWSAAQEDTRLLKRGATRLCYALADVLVTDYMQTVEALDDRIDEIEDQVFSNPTEDVLNQIFTLKRALLQLRRTLAPQREVLNKLARGDVTVITEPDRVYFRDVYDHLVRLYDITDSMRDLVGGVLDMYLSVVNNRMNDVMKTLTVITTLFMPLSFLAGFFGMNFFQPTAALPAWTGMVAFRLMLATMVLAPLGMYWWMHRRGWM